MCDRKSITGTWHVTLVLIFQMQGCCAVKATQLEKFLFYSDCTSREIQTGAWLKDSSSGARLVIAGTWEGAYRQGYPFVINFISDHQSVWQPYDPAKFLVGPAIRQPGLPFLAFRTLSCHKFEGNRMYTYKCSRGRRIDENEKEDEMIEIEVLSESHVRFTAKKTIWEKRLIKDAYTTHCRHFSMGRRLFAAKEWNAAISELRKADFLYPTEETLLGIGLCYYKLREWENAYRVFNRFREAYPRSAVRKRIEKVMQSIVSRIGSGRAAEIWQETRVDAR